MFGSRAFYARSHGERSPGSRPLPKSTCSARPASTPGRLRASCTGGGPAGLAEHRSGSRAQVHGHVAPSPASSARWYSHRPRAGAAFGSALFSNLLPWPVLCSIFGTPLFWCLGGDMRGIEERTQTGSAEPDTTISNLERRAFQTPLPPLTGRKAIPNSSSPQAQQAGTSPDTALHTRGPPPPSSCLPVLTKTQVGRTWNVLQQNSPRHTEPAPLCHRTPWHAGRQDKCRSGKAQLAFNRT